jgi:hypothetical protein
MRRIPSGARNTPHHSSPGCDGQEKRRPSAPWENCGNPVCLFCTGSCACDGRLEPASAAAPVRESSVDHSERAAAADEIEIVEGEGQHLDDFIRLRNFRNGLEFDVFDVHGCFLFRK